MTSDMQIKIDLGMAGEHTVMVDFDYRKGTPAKISPHPELCEEAIPDELTINSVLVGPSRNPIDIFTLLDDEALEYLAGEIRERIDEAECYNDDMDLY